MILILDNYDSFVHNLARYVRRAGATTRVVRSDRITAEEVMAMRPDGVLISPGPHRPEDAGCSIDVLGRAPSDLPILGVCLGHQAIGVAFGASLVRCSPVHGMASAVTHDAAGLYRGLPPNPTPMARYHSLALQRSSIRSPLRVTATAADGVVMGVRHTDRPIEGVQFHPESILSDHGAVLVRNFVDQTRRRHHRAAAATWVNRRASAHAPGGHTPGNQTTGHQAISHHASRAPLVS